MKDPLRTSIAALLFAALVPAQTVPVEPAAALARAKVLEEREGDLKAAEQAYRALLDGKDAGAVHAEAALRLGAMLWKLDRKDDGKPFLERAVAAGGELGAQATAVLQGQDAEQKQAQERLARARALVERIGELLGPRETTTTNPDTQPLDAARSDLKWLGDAAARALCEHLGQLKNAIVERRGDAAAVAYQAPVFIDLLWSIGTAPALTFLNQAAADPSVEWRRCLTRNAQQIAPDLFPAVLLFLHDPDPTGEVQRNLSRFLHLLSLADLQQLIADENGAARAAGLEGLAATWPGLSTEERERTFAATAERLRDALRAADPRSSRAAWRLVRSLAKYGPRAARQLVLGALAQYPDSAGELLDHNVASTFAIDDEELAMLLLAARDLGAYTDRSRDSHDAARNALAVLFVLHEPAWSERSVDGVLGLLDAGYCSYPGMDPRWLTRFFALAKPPQLVRFVRALPRLTLVQQALQRLATTDLPPEAFPAVRDVIDECFRKAPEKWQFLSRRRSNRRGVGVEVQGPGNELASLLLVVSRTRSDEAAVWLTQFVDRLPAAAYLVAGSLVQLSGSGVGEPARIGMRRLLAWEGTPEIDLEGNVRSMLFAELARLGDVPSIALYPRAYALGLGNYDAWGPRPGPNPSPPNQPQISGTGISFLGLRSIALATPGAPWHSYTDEQLVEAWRTLLASDARETVWQEVLNMQNRVPLQVLPLLAEVLSAFQARSAPEERNVRHSQLLGQFRNVTREMAAPGSPFHAAIVSLLRADDFDLAGITFLQLNREVAQQFADEGRALLRRAPHPSRFAQQVLDDGIELTSDDWRVILGCPSRTSMAQILDRLPLPLDPALLRTVEALLKDDSAAVRAAVCKTLARLLAADSVAPLLEALRDPSDAVRKAATEALEQIRFHQEQQSFWQNAKAGIDTSPTSAAAKLLTQARPGEAKDQRLLAIRSLAVLGAPEALPYLIDWTKDTDAEIAAAAREAVATIHRTAGAKK